MNDFSANDLEVSNLEAKIEAALIVSSSPVTAAAIAKVQECSIAEASRVLDTLEKKYAAGYGFILKNTSQGYRFYTHPNEAEFAQKFISSLKQEQILSMNALETLAIIAYKGPISRLEINTIRGVKSDSTLRTLLIRDLIYEAEAKGENAASLFEVTPLFLEKMNISSLKELSPLSPYLSNNLSQELVEEKSVI